MRLGYFTMPLHPPQREWRRTMTEDQEAIVLADELGYHDAFVGEHLTDRAENVTNSLLFLATLIEKTSRIKLATGTSNLTHMHPAVVAANAAMFDHLSNGRFILGVSPGTLKSDAELLGNLDRDMTAMYVEAIDAILRLWAEEPPYDIPLPARDLTISTARTIMPDFHVGGVPKPLQQPRPEIVATIASPHSSTATMAGKKGLHPISANFLLSQWVATHWPKYQEGCAAAGSTADRADWRVARTIFVADDDRTAEAYGRADAASPYRFYYGHLYGKFAVGKRLGMFKSDPSLPDEAVTLETVLDDCVICGPVNKVVDEILALREEIGDFGELVYAGLDWADPALARRSMELMAADVMPRVNAAIGSATAGAGLAAAK